MPLRLDVKRKLLARSDRVKSTDLHPTESWMLVSLYNGNVHIWNYETQALVKSFEVCDQPVRSAKFVARKSWIVCGSDDMHVRVYNYNTMERVHQFEAHSDYMRCVPSSPAGYGTCSSLAVHPTQPFLLTSCDDMLVKMWDWDSKWVCKQQFEGHTHYVMQVVINPKDNNTFATASLDRTIKVWQFGSTQPNFTLEGHEKGVNCIDYYHGGDKPYLISGADDRCVKIWDYQNKTCVITLDGHASNISAVCFHPELPLIITGSEDSTVRLWHSGTNRLETTLNYGLERVWAITAMKGSNTVAIGYDEGSVIIKVGREEPAVSMDSSGKILWAKHSEVQQANLKTLSDADVVNDGERLPLSVKDMGACEIYPQTVQHSPNGRFCVVCGDGEYIIYTSMALRNKAYGSALEFVWSSADANMYAVRESATIVKLFKNFKEVQTLKTDYAIDGIDGGHLLGVRSAHALCLYEWDTLRLIRRIEITAKSIDWAPSGDKVAVITDDSFFVLKYDAAAAQEASAATDDGFEEAFEVAAESQEIVKTSLWVGECFVYTTPTNRLNYFVGGETVTIAHLDRPLYLLGYMSRDSRLYAIDKEHNVVSYLLSLAVLEYQASPFRDSLMSQTAIMRHDFDAADKVLPTVPKDQRTRVAQFLEKQGFRKQALAVSTDPEHQFDLAIALGELEMAKTIALTSDSEEKWRQLSHAASARSQLNLAGECLGRAKDYGGLLLLATAAGSQRMINKLSEESTTNACNNVAFAANLLQGNLDACLTTLISTERLPEAAMFARTYCPSQVERVLQLWKDKVSTTHPKVAQSLASPKQYPNLFPNTEENAKGEKYLRMLAAGGSIPAAAYAQVPPNAQRSVLQEMQDAVDNGALDLSVDTEEPITVIQQSTTNNVPLPRKPMSPARSSTPPRAPSPARTDTPPTVVRAPTPQSPVQPQPPSDADDDEDDDGDFDEDEDNFVEAADEHDEQPVVQPDVLSRRPDVLPTSTAPDVVAAAPPPPPADDFDWDEDEFDVDDDDDQVAPAVNAPPANHQYDLDLEDDED